MSTKPVDIVLDIPELSINGYTQLSFIELYQLYKDSKSIYTLYNGVMIRGYIVAYQTVEKNNEPVVYIGFRTGNIGEPRLPTIPNTFHCFVTEANEPMFTRVFHRTASGEPLIEDIRDALEESIRDTAKLRRILAVSRYAS